MEELQRLIYRQTRSTGVHRLRRWPGCRAESEDHIFPGGNRDLVLHYVSPTIRDNTLSVSLKDVRRDVAGDLMDEETGVLARSARIENRSKQPFTIEQVFLRRGT